MTAVTVNLNHVVLSLDDLANEAAAMNGRKHDPDGPGGSRRPEVAATTRDLLALADRLDLCAALVRQEYWALKGRERL